MPAELILLLGATMSGGLLQVGIGIGFSVLVGPLLFLTIGPASAVPLLLLLNVVVSLIATPGAVTAQDRTPVFRLALACVAGIAIGIVIYPYLSPATVLAIAGTMLVVGALVAFLPVSEAGKRAILPVSGLSGLATVWAATPGPLMALGLIMAGHPGARVRKLVQPIALIGYSVALLLHGPAGWAYIVDQPMLAWYLAAAIIGSLLGRMLGPALPQVVISSGIRAISLIAGMVLIYRAFTLA
jgi:uncharacterized membrane protein YfcA